ncbi:MULTISPECIES: hypothetical protein [unclassified Microcoleus]|nr:MULTISPECIES: hypothetical protein [unclassified Microcoleus]
MGQILLYPVDGATGDRVILRWLPKIARMAEVRRSLRDIAL